MKEAGPRALPLPPTVALDDGDSALLILDQTLLPGEARVLRLHSQEEIREAICELRVRGAPAIGVAAALGTYLAAKAIKTEDPAQFLARFKEARDRLASSRPTAVNLFWALDRMAQVPLRHPASSVARLKALLRSEALAILAEDARVCRGIAEHGLSLLRDGDGVLTHCNAGRLATAGYGTALAPIHLGLERGMGFRVFAGETRPLLQGARLTTYELLASGADTVLICDSMVSQVMGNGWVQAVLTGCDRVAANGDTCNKIGTSGIAILARHYGIPFYVCAPVSTLDLSLKTGGEIPIEERPAREVTELWYEKPMAPEGVGVYNPAFDITPHELITAFVTEHGIVRPPFEEGLRRASGISRIPGG